MANRCCFVQFPHPGGEPGGDLKSKIGWNKASQSHKRKFMQLEGEWLDKDCKAHAGSLRAWGEWEPESELIRKFGTEDGEPHYPKYLWKPYWIPKSGYRGLHNTDPLIFGNCFLYSNCHQFNQPGLRTLGHGSVIAFGSGKNIEGERKWVLDTVLVVRDSLQYDPLNPRKALEAKVPEEFLKLTGCPLAASVAGCGNGLAHAACAPKSDLLRLYRGATPDHHVNGMFSFFPAIAAVGEARFSRPVVSLDDKFLNPSNWRTPKGASSNLRLKTLRDLWDSLVEQVHKAGLVLGTRAEMPESRSE